MKPISGLRLLLAVLAAFAPRLGAQETPEQVAERYYAAFRTGDVPANAALMHPEALEELKGALVRMAGIPGATDEPEFREMFGVATVEELQALPARAIFERVLAHQMRGEMREIAAGTQVQVLGHVLEGDSLAHVVYRMRMSFGGQSLDRVQLLPLRRADGGWRVLLTGSLAETMSAFPAAPDEP